MTKTMIMLYPLMEAVRSGGDLTKVGGDGKYSKAVVCPDETQKQNPKFGE